MGKKEAIQEQRLVRSDKVINTDKSKVARDRDMTENYESVDNGTETSGDLDKTTVTDNASPTDRGNPKPSTQTSPTIENSSPVSNEQHEQMWEEAALRYQEILHREYRMLNLPFYPVQGGYVYFYYFPLMTNGQPVPQNYAVYNVCDSKAKAADESTENSENVIYVSDDSDDEYITSVKEEPLKYVQAVEKTSPYRNHVKLEYHNERFCPEMVSCKKEKGRYDNVVSSTFKQEPLTTIKVEKESDYEDSCIGFKQDGKVISKEKTRNLQTSYVNESVKHPRQSECCGDDKIEVREGHIRIIKGYTIEYHPLPTPNTVNRWLISSEMETQQDKKIQDLKKRLAEQEEELQKLKLQQSLEGKNSRMGSANRTLPRKCAENGEVNEFTDPREWKLLKEFPSAEIHYFPSGERRTFLPRRNSRKQTLPRRIDASSNLTSEKEIHDALKNAQMEKNISGEVNCSVAKRKRKLTPFPGSQEDKRDEPEPCQNNWIKRAQPSKKVKRRRNRRKARQISQVFGQSQSWCNKTQVELTCTGSMCKATLPKDITQDEFLSIFGLIRMRGQQSGTLSV